MFPSVRKQMGEMGGKFVKGNWAIFAHSAPFSCAPALTSLSFLRQGKIDTNWQDQF
jgi:hypothetical protein